MQPMQDEYSTAARRQFAYSLAQDGEACSDIEGMVRRPPLRADGGGLLLSLKTRSSRTARAGSGLCQD